MSTPATNKHPTGGPDLRAVPDDGDMRTPPHDIQAEQSALGAMMLDPHVIDDVAAMIGAADFYRPAHSTIFETVTRIHGRGEPADAITVVAELTRTGDLVRVGGGPYVHTLINQVPTAANATWYAQIVRGTSGLRRIIDTGTRLVQRGYGGNYTDVDELLAQAQEDLLREDTSGDPIPRLDSAADEAIDWLETDPADDPARISLPYQDLDRILEGLHPGQLVIVGARPATGKSVVALDVARHAALRQGSPVMFASIEMRRLEVMLRLYAAECRIPLDRLRGRRMSDDDWRKVADIRARIGGAPKLLIDDSTYVTLDSLRAKLRQMSHRDDVGPARLLVVDYLQLLKPSGGGRAENRQVEVAEFSRGLKLMAGEFGIPVVACAQLNRSPEQRADKRPAVSDLRESGAVEQDADVVILLHREDATDKESPRSGELDLIVGKNRNGPMGTVSAAFLGHYSSVRDMAPDAV